MKIGDDGVQNEWSPLRQEPEAPFNNATSRVQRRNPPAGAGGLQVAGFMSIHNKLKAGEIFQNEPGEITL
jgi:hypothetical protein